MMLIQQRMHINEVITRYPHTVEVFRYYDMGCFRCAAAATESIEEGAAAHGIDIDALLQELNKRAYIGWPIRFNACRRTGTHV